MAERISTTREQQLLRRIEALEAGIQKQALRAAIDKGLLEQRVRGLRASN